MCDDDAKAAPVDAIVRLNRPKTYGSGKSYNFTWSPESGLRERS